MPACLAGRQFMPFQWWSLVWPGLGVNPWPTTWEANMLPSGQMTLEQHQNLVEVGRLFAWFFRLLQMLNKSFNQIRWWSLLYCHVIFSLLIVVQTPDSPITPVFSSCEINNTLSVRQLSLEDVLMTSQTNGRKKRAIVSTTYSLFLGDLTNQASYNKPLLPVTVSVCCSFFDKL